MAIAIFSTQRRAKIKTTPRSPSRFWLTAALVLILALAYLIVVLRRPPVIPTLHPAIQITARQVYVDRVKDIRLEFILPGNQPRVVHANDSVSFAAGSALRTTPGESGYAFLGLPGRAEMFLDQATQLHLISSDKTGEVIRLDKGSLFLYAPADYAGMKPITVLSVGGAHTWLDGSKMCLSYEPASQALRLDCIAGPCGYTDQEKQEVQTGYHVTFTGKAVTEAKAGLAPDACQFVPGMGPPSDSTAARK